MASVTFLHQFHYDQKRASVERNTIYLSYPDPNKFFKSFNFDKIPAEDYLPIVRYYLNIRGDKTTLESISKEADLHGDGLREFHACQIGINYSEETLKKVKKILNLSIEHSDILFGQLDYPYSEGHYNDSFGIYSGKVFHSHPSLSAFLNTQQSYSLADLEMLKIVVEADITSFKKYKESDPGPNFQITAEMGLGEDELLLPLVEKQLQKLES